MASPADLPDWTQVFIAMGGSSLLSGGLAWLTGLKFAAASARKANAEAAKLESEVRIEAIRVEASRVDFEKTLNERITILMSSFQSQVKYLSELVETQSGKINAQSLLMAKMEQEIQELHKALDAKTRHLHQVLAMLPHVKELYDTSGELDVNLLGNPA